MGFPKASSWIKWVLLGTLHGKADIAGVVSPNPNCVNACFSPRAHPQSQPPQRDSTNAHPLQVEENEEPQSVDASTLLPHEVFGAIYRMGESKAWGSDMVIVPKKESTSWLALL